MTLRPLDRLKARIRLAIGELVVAVVLELARELAKEERRNDPRPPEDFGDSTPTKHRSDTRGPCLACRARYASIEEAAR